MGRGGKRPETFLTPYEMELLPMMLKELDKVNSRFYQMVCYRWLQSATSKTIDGDSIRTKKSTIDYPTGISREAKSSIEDSNKAANKGRSTNSPI
jgi:hypothetical protein